ncbi:unnamed protein product [Notodromas monacha]|uniref:Nuclear receptor domain-containing protein n=1 Tax=Notodromas monacha TaxID=399045 RepID=A0A7R9BJ53_9CRUS|nr:unnamed protein product [Notodromas monacha]CAG0915363.1 unnamed protein product [Notodromas monacha]
MPRVAKDDKPKDRMTAYAFFLQACRNGQKKENPRLLFSRNSQRNALSDGRSSAVLSRTTVKVDAVTRRFCQRCRLRKCFDVGMKKEWIMSDEEKVKKKQKIEANRVRRLLDNGVVASGSTDLWTERRRYPSSEACQNGIRNEIYSRDEQLQQRASVDPVINSGGSTSSSIDNNAMNNESLLMSSLLSPQTEDGTCGRSTQMNSQQESGSSY